MKRRDAIGALGALGISALLGNARQAPGRGKADPGPAAGLPTIVVRQRGALTFSVVLAQGMASSALQLEAC
jgi:hypothetical protein